MNDNIICTFGNNIYDLYNELIEYDECGDIVSLMRERLAERGDSTLDGIRSSDISEIFLFFDDDFQNGIVYILFLLGGSFAVSKANDVIARLCGADAGRNELASMIYNVRSGMALTHAINHKVGGAVGKFIGGNAYTKARNKGATRKQALQSSASARINEHKVKPSKKPQNKAQKVSFFLCTCAKSLAFSVKRLLSLSSCPKLFTIRIPEMIS